MFNTNCIPVMQALIKTIVSITKRPFNFRAILSSGLGFKGLISNSWDVNDLLIAFVTIPIFDNSFHYCLTSRYEYEKYILNSLLPFTRVCAFFYPYSFITFNLICILIINHDTAFVQYLYSSLSANQSHQHEQAIKARNSELFYHLDGGLRV